MGHFIHFNNKIISEDQPIYTAANRAARFGDGIFETMRIRYGKILFEELHAARLLNGLQLLRFDPSPEFTWSQLRSSIVSLLQKNGNPPHARVRLMITRGEGAIMQAPVNSPQVLIESWETDEYLFNAQGLKVDVYQDFPRSRNAFSNIKTCNFLPSVMAAIHVREKNLDECLMLNDLGRICDATISNLFWIRNGSVFTAPLSEGGVGGVMRSHLLQLLPQHGIPVNESPVNVSELHAAEELFLTNVIRGVQWVKQLDNSTFTNHYVRKVFEMMIASVKEKEFS